MSDINTNENNKEALCPSCREPIQNTSRSKFVERQVLKLRVICSNNNIGCKWKGELKYFKKHLKQECKFVNMLCKYCNNITYLRGKENEHFNICNQYLIECNLCLQKIQRKLIKKHEETLCPNILLLCTNNCGIKIKQLLLKNHITNECKNRKINCLYHCYGCNYKPKYTDLKLHLSQHQVVHLEMKILYLERLAQSTELLSISNTTGIYPEISGLYSREETPYLGRPVWKNKNNNIYLIRYDNILNGWVVDKKGYNNDIVAARIGKYPTAIAKNIDPKHILQLEDMLINDNKNENDNIVIQNDDDDNNNDEQKQIIIDEQKIEIMESKSNDNDVKPLVKNDGLWHVVGNLQISRIKVRGYTEREFDLEWEFKSLAAVMRRQRSGIQHVTINNNNINTNNEDNEDNKELNNIRKNYVVGCICGKGMVKTNSNPYNSNNKELNAICNICENRILTTTEFFHCPSKRCTKHLDGYDLCLACGEARQQTQNLTQPTCDCGNKLFAIMSFNAYPNTSGVSCNICSKTVNGVIWHCNKKYSKAHERGFDLCISCGKTYVSKKVGLMSWWNRH